MELSTLQANVENIRKRINTAMPPHEDGKTSLWTLIADVAALCADLAHSLSLLPATPPAPAPEASPAPAPEAPAAPEAAAQPSPEGA